MHDSWWRCQAYLGGCYQYNYNTLLYLSTSVTVFPRKHSVILFCCSVIYVKCCLWCNFVSLFINLLFFHNTTGIMISSVLLWYWLLVILKRAKFTSFQNMNVKKWQFLTYNIYVLCCRYIYWSKHSVHQHTTASLSSAPLDAWLTELTR